MTNGASCWFIGGQARVRGNLRLFCFPYAGGTSLIYKHWAASLPAEVQVVRVELPGRGSRMKEPAFANLPPLVEVLTEVTLPLRDAPFPFFGHSMGAMIAFELARRLRREDGSEPQMLIVTGRPAPQLPSLEPATYDLPKAQFIEELKRIAGTPREVLEHGELMDLMIPLLRADFQLSQTYRFSPDTPLHCPIIAYGGVRDETTRDMIFPWREHTSSDFTLHMMPGDHFFLRSCQSQLLRSLTHELQEIIRRSPLKSQKDSFATVMS